VSLQNGHVLIEVENVLTLLFFLLIFFFLFVFFSALAFLMEELEFLPLGCCSTTGCSRKTIEQ
jgi:phosphatidylglycerophosphate synthase